MLEFIESFLNIPYLKRKSEIQSIKKRVEKKLDNPKYMKGRKVEIFSEETKNKKTLFQFQTKVEKDDLPFIKYELSKAGDETSKKNISYLQTGENDKIKKK